jgi:hypothetical protein
VAEVIDTESCFEPLPGEIAPPGRTGIVDEYVHGLSPLENGARRFAHSVQVVEIQRYVLGLPALPSKLRDQLLTCVLVTIQKQQPRPSLRQDLGGHTADAGACSRDEHAATTQFGNNHTARLLQGPPRNHFGLEQHPRAAPTTAWT